MDGVLTAAPRAGSPGPAFQAVAQARRFTLRGRREPTVFRGLAAHWPAVSCWSLGALADRAPELPVKLVVGNRERERTRFVHSTLRAHLRALQHHDHGPAEPMYLKEFDLLGAMPELRDDLRYGSLLPRHGVSSVQSWVGPAGARTGLHYDLPDNIAVQLVGFKRFLLVRPDVVRRLGAVSDKYDKWAVLARCGARDLAARWREHPAADQAPAFLTVDLAPGDVLHVPAGWWHEVLNLSHGISLGGFYGGYARAAVVRTWVAARDLAHRLNGIGRAGCTCHAGD